MQAKFLLGFLLVLVTNVSAGGFAGALERVWMFYAYQIDGLNDPADRTLGFKCLGWDKAGGKCRLKKGTTEENWKECQGVLPGRRCTFSQLFNSVGGATTNQKFAADKDGNLLDLKATDMDPEQTAKNVYDHFLAKEVDNPKVSDYPPYKFMKGSNENYANYVEKMGDVVAKAAAAGKNTGANKVLFDRFADLTERINRARVGDHGKFLIPAAQKILEPQGITVVKGSVEPGHNPADSSQVWETVDWDKTMSGALEKGTYSELELLLITSNMREQFYTEDKVAKEHKVVMQAYEDVEDKAKGCI